MGRQRKKRKKSIGDYLLTFLLLVALGVFAFAAYRLYDIYAEYKEGVDEYNKIEEMAVSQNPNQPEKRADDIVKIVSDRLKEPPITVNFKKLEAANPDVVGWIYIEGIEISYPLMKGKDNEEYLYHTYERTYNIAGSIFLEYTNKEDFSDSNTIIYGHNMKNGSMFGTLKNFVEQDAYEKSPYIWILTPEENYCYEIFSAYITPVESETYTLFKGPDKAVKEYIEAMQKNSAIETKTVEANAKDKVITLSTCTGDDTTRFVVQAIRL